ncbi:unnamed protein product [Closterium sp. NIES-54]
MEERTISEHVRDGEANRAWATRKGAAGSNMGRSDDGGKRKERGLQRRRTRRTGTCAEDQERHSSAGGRSGHGADDCYTKQREERGKGGRKTRIQALEEELRRLKAEEDQTGEEEEEAALMAGEKEAETEEPFFMAYQRERGREDLGLRSAGVDGCRDTSPARRGPRERVTQATARAAAAVQEAEARVRERTGPLRHPHERMAARPCVVEAKEGMVAMEGKYPGATIIDTGASQVLIGRRLAERLGLHQEDMVTREGVRIQSAEGGVGKWLPKTRRPQEIVLAPGSEDEARIRVHCLISDSDNYDLLLGMELLYKAGAAVDTWTEQVTYQPRYWDADLRGEKYCAAVLPARFLRIRPEDLRRSGTGAGSLCKDRPEDTKMGVCGERGRGAAHGVSPCTATITAAS